MQNIAAREARRNFGELLDTSQREPVTIEKHGRPVAVLLSSHEYEELKLACLRTALVEGEESGMSEKTIDQIVSEEQEKRKIIANETLQIK